MEGAEMEMTFASRAWRWSSEDVRRGVRSDIVRKDFKRAIT